MCWKLNSLLLKWQLVLKEKEKALFMSKAPDVYNSDDQVKQLYV